MKIMSGLELYNLNYMSVIPNKFMNIFLIAGYIPISGTDSTLPHVKLPVVE